MKEHKWICGGCSHRCDDNTMLYAPNPFDSKTYVTGCPNCAAVDKMKLICDEPECWEEVCCGTPTPTGYRKTCGKHRPV